ncbi:hypothetical protein C7999DRAFT_11782 [Corynascus novoguineensis]|uniref:Nucleotide exchange factor SIL1 n=1 Tax=Corynascus novoguineensis TaxID=1126955 RepID=A0AAN7HHR4_9PEZI|nr:hypothetical protein C7999DRAFT_11782 [Corynascus novoguineensis]
MAKYRVKLLPLNLVALISLMAWGASASASAAGESASSSSPSADVELICHTDNPAECYPKVFQATDEFQVVHPDQDLPMGLHVRLNVYTGLKEAKINVPDENDPALEGLPVDSSVVVVERDQGEEQVKPPPNAPAYDPAGTVKKPKSADPGESSAFYKSLTILKKGLDVDGALDMLEEISHDIYYGLKIAEDYDTVHELFCLSTRVSEDETALRRARLASLILASTLQNNPKALAEIESHWSKLGVSTCNVNGTPLESSVFTLLPSDGKGSAQAQTEEPAAGRSPNPGLTKARISLITSLLKSPLFRTAFLSSSQPSSPSAGGPSHILRILTTPYSDVQQQHEQKESNKVEEWGSAQRRAAILLLDTFLDADMGATPGQWPSKAQLADKECAALFDGRREGQGREEECADWLVKGLSDKHKKDEGHWAHDLWQKMRGRDKGSGEKVDL